jgi:glucokinase
MLQNSIKTKVVGVDIGHEITTYAIVDVRGMILAKGSFRNMAFPNVNVYISHLSDRIVELVEANGGYELVRSVGISTPSGNCLTGSIVHSPHLPWKGEIPLAAMLRDRLGLAVAVANDAHVRALGELAFGCARGMKDFILLTLGYGFGSSIVSNGHVHLGNNGFAGEIGHVCVRRNGRQCACGHRGCLEAYCCSDGIVLTAKELMQEYASEPSLMREAASLTPKFITECCERGDRLAVETYNRTGFLLGLCLANYASVINPEAMILTGGIANAGKWLIEPADRAMEEHIFHNINNKVKFMTSSLGDDECNLLGASALAWDVKEYSLFK